MLFKVTKNDVFKDNPELMAFDEFIKATSRQLKYVFLTYDYETPLRRLPISERKEQAAIIAGYRKEKDGSRLDKNARNIIEGKVKTVEEATIAFKKLQFDSDKDAYEAYCAELDEIKSFLRMPNKKLAEKKMALTYMEKYESLTKKKKDLEEILDIRRSEETEEEDFSNRTISTLDRYNIAKQNG